MDSIPSPPLTHILFR